MEIAKNPVSFQTAASTDEQEIRVGPCRLYSVSSSADTQGTITLRNGLGGDTVHICAIGMLAAGKNFGHEGVDCYTGLSVQLSDAADTVYVSWEAI